MSVRELVFDIGFKGDATALLKADQAVTGFKNSVVKVGAASDTSIGKSIKGFENLGDSISKSSRETISFTKDMKDIVSKSNVVQNLKTVGDSAKTHIGDTLTKVAKISSDKLSLLGESVKNSLGRAFPEASSHGRVTIGVLNDIGNAGKSAFTSLKTHIEKTSVANQKLSKDLDGMSKKLDDISKSSGKVGDSFNRKVTIPLGIAGVAALKTGIDFEAGMSEVKALSGASGKEMEALTQKAREMGSKTKFSAVQSAQALKYMGMAGWNSEKMLAGLPGVMNLAASSGEDLGIVSDIVTDSMTAFGLSADKSTHFADVLAQASSKSNTSVGLMGETFKYAAPVAGALGYSIEDTAIAIGLMANKGIKGSQAGTALRATFTNLAKPTDQMQTAMSELGISLTDTQGKIKPFSAVMGDMRKGFSKLSEAQKAQYAATIFGQEAMSGMLGIIDTSESDYKNLTDAIYGANGAAKNQADIMNDNLKGSFTELGSAISEISLQMYDILSPSIKQGVDFVKKLVNQFSELDDNAKLTIVKFLGLSMAIGPLFKIFSFATLGLSKFTGALSFLMKFNAASTILKMGTGISKVSGALSAFKGLGFAGSMAKIGGAIVGFGASILPVILIVGALVAAGYLLYKNWDLIKAKGTEFVSSLQSKFISFVPVVQNIWANLQTVFKALLPVFSGVLSGIGTMLGGFIMTAATLVGNIITVFSGITDFLIGVFTGNWSQVWSGVQQIFTGTFKGIETIFKGTINFLTGGLNSFISGVNGIKIPDWIPGIGGKNISIPLIPKFAKGVDNFAGGLAVVGEKGPELLNIPGGSSVTSNAKTEKLFNGGVSKLSQESDDTSTASSSFKKTTYIFSPSIEINTSSDKPQEIAEATKNKVKDWFEEWIDDADIAS